MNDEFEQKYDPALQEPVQVWLYCRLCRCRIQVRTVPRPALPFRCFCGNAGTFASFDVFSREDDVVKFAKTFEDLYQETKLLLKEAEMPMPRTQTYKPGELARIMRGEAVGAPRPPEASGDEISDIEASDTEVDEEARFKEEVRELTAAVQKATDPIARHDALSALGKFLFARRNQNPEARRLCYQACEAQAQGARDVIREASARYRRGVPVQLRFPLVKRLVALLTEDQKLDRALAVAERATALGIPGYEERVARLRQQLGR